jgi:predicted DNA-binding transcriptional regulator YafY
MQGAAATYRAVATVYAPAAEVAARLGGSAAGALEPVDEASCRWHSTPEALEWLAVRLALLGHEFTVHEPPELVAYLRAMGGRAQRAAGEDGGAAP